MDWKEAAAYLGACLPEKLAHALEKAGPLREIRIRADQAASLKTEGGFERTSYVPNGEQVTEMAEALCEHALYARAEEMRQGFVTLKGGHRMGLCGRVLTQGSQVRALRDIASLCIRIAGEYPGSADEVMKHLYPKGTLQSVLIIGSPGAGKTTLLRDICRQLSDGGSGREQVSACMIDERGELAACVHGVPQLNVGRNTDVLDGCPKSVGMQWLLRSMAPGCMVTDELGGEEDALAVLEAVRCGVPVMTSVHGQSLNQAMERPALRALMQEKVFGLYVLLDRSVPGRITAFHDSCLNVL